MKVFVRQAPFVSLCFIFSECVTAQHWDADLVIERSGDVLQLALPMAALTATYTLDDAIGRRQLLKSYTSTFLSTHLLKRVVNKERPDGSNRLSFPSGHTSSAFSGAAFLSKRYGWQVGLPAYLAASFTGYSRVHAKKHDWIDVASGAALAVGVNALFVEMSPNTSVSYLPVSSGGSVLVSYRF